MFYGTRTDWEDVDIVWTMEIEYLGDEYRFAGISLDLVDDDGQSYPYIGGLEDIEVSQSLQKVGDISMEADSVSIAITFPSRNIAQDQMNGKFIEGSKVKIGYVLVQNGQILSDYGNRPIIFQGIVTTPVYGHPDQSTGYVEFSIENQVFFFCY